jgi:hypothetical protein
MRLPVHQVLLGAADGIAALPLLHDEVGIDQRCRR